MARAWSDNEEASPLARARGVARALWQQFHRALDRKYYLVATLRHDRRLTPEDQHRIGGILAEINEHLGELDGRLEAAELVIKRILTRTSHEQ